MNIQKTRCPHCSSIFTVSDTQLSIRDGYTRCGKCFKVFKADDYLLVEPQTSAAPSTPTLFDNIERKPASITIMATMAKPEEPAPAKKLDSIEDSKPVVVAKTIPNIETTVATEESAAEDKLASTLNDQPLATLARMLANELSLLQPQPLLPIASAVAAEPTPAIPDVEAEPELAQPELVAERTESIRSLTPHEFITSQTGTTAPVMSHIFEQEFNDLWLSATDHSKPLASAIAISTAAEKTREQAQSAPTVADTLLDDGLTEHFNSSESDIAEIAAPAPTPAPAPAPIIAAQAEFSEAMMEMPSIAAHRTVEEEHDDEEDLFSYLNKNNVAAAPVNLRPKRILPGMQAAAEVEQKALNKTTNRSTIAQHPRQPTSKRTALPPIKRPNVVMERLTQPIPFFTLNIPKALGWGFLSLIMLALLGAQVLYFNFDRLAAQPAYSASLKQMCEYVGCEVPVIDVSKIKITSKLARHYPDAPNEATRFTATMVNHAENSQPYPSLKVLILKKGEIQSGRIVKPSEYIPSGYTALDKIPANTPIQIRFVLKIPREQISVFALDPI